jgi:hypothetical protein
MTRARPEIPVGSFRSRAASPAHRTGRRGGAIPEMARGTPGNRCALSHMVGRPEERFVAATAALEVQNKGGIHGRPTEFPTGGEAPRAGRPHRIQRKE